MGAEEEIYSFDTAILISKPIIPESKIIDVLETSILQSAPFVAGFSGMITCKLLRKYT